MTDAFSSKTIVYSTYCSKFIGRGNLQEQLGSPFVFTGCDSHQGLKPSHARISCGGVRERIRSGLLLDMTRVAVGVGSLSTTDL
jgi:hypothetical protein